MSSLKLPGSHTVNTKKKTPFRSLRQAEQIVAQEKMHQQMLAQQGDTVPAMLSPGEFVLPQETVQQIGPENLNNLVQQTTGLRPPQGGQPLEGGLRGFVKGGEIPPLMDEALRRAGGAMERVDTPRPAPASPPPTSPEPDARERMKAQAQAGRAKVEARLAARTPPATAAGAVEGAAARTTASAAPTAARSGASLGLRALTPVAAAATAYELTSPEYRSYVADAARELGVGEGVINATGELAKTYIDPLREKVGGHADAFMTEAEQRVPQHLGELRARIQDAPATRRDPAGFLAERREALVRALTGQPEPEPTPGSELIYTPESAMFDFNMNPVGPPSPAGVTSMPAHPVGKNPPWSMDRTLRRSDPPPPASVLNEPAASDAQADPTTPAAPVYPADTGTSRLARAELSNFGVGAGASMPAVYADSSVTPEMRAQEADRSRADLQRQTAYFDNARAEREARAADAIRERRVSSDRRRLIQERDELRRKGPDVPLEIFAMRSGPEKRKYMEAAQNAANLRLGAIDQALAGSSGGGASGGTGGMSNMDRLNALRAEVAKASSGGKAQTPEEYAKDRLSNRKTHDEINRLVRQDQVAADVRAMGEDKAVAADNLWLGLPRGAREILEEEAGSEEEIARVKKTFHTVMDKLQKQNPSMFGYSPWSYLFPLGTYFGTKNLKPLSHADEEIPTTGAFTNPETGELRHVKRTMPGFFTQPMKTLRSTWSDSQRQVGDLIYDTEDMSSEEKTMLQRVFSVVEELQRRQAAAQRNK